MALIIDLDPKLENRLEEEAAKRGLESGEYARRLIEQNLQTQGPAAQSLWDTLTPEEWIRQTREWIETHHDWPVLPPEAYERASFYEDRE